MSSSSYLCPREINICVIKPRAGTSRVSLEIVRAYGGWRAHGALQCCYNWVSLNKIIVAINWTWCVDPQRPTINYGFDGGITVGRPIIKMSETSLIHCSTAVPYCPKLLVVVMILQKLRLNNLLVFTLVSYCWTKWPGQLLLSFAVWNSSCNLPFRV